MIVRETSVLAVEGGGDMREDPVVGRYVAIAAGLGEHWGRAVVLDQHGRVVMGQRRWARAVRHGDLVVPAARVEVSDEEARLLRLADFAENDGLVLMTLERILAGGTGGAGGPDGAGAGCGTETAA